MSADQPNGSPKRPAEVSAKVRRYLEDPKVAAKIQSLYEETRLSLQGPKPVKDESHLERLSDLEESARFERASHEEWLKKLPEEKQRAYLELMFFMQSMRGQVIEYGEILAEEGSEQFEMGIIYETFDGLNLEPLEEEEIENDRIKLLAIHYARVRKYITNMKSTKKKYRTDGFSKHIADTIRIFEFLVSEESDQERKEAIDKGLQDLRQLHQAMSERVGQVSIEELEKLEACYLQIPELKTVIPHGSTMVGRIYGEKMKPLMLNITQQRIANAVSEEATTESEVEAKAEFIQGQYVSDMFPISEEGDAILAESLTEDLLRYIPKNIPRNLRAEFRTELKELMIAINRILLHLQSMKDINGFDTDSNKNLQISLLHGVREDLEGLKALMKEQAERIIAVKSVELEPASDEIETITCEVEVRQSEVLRGSEEGEKNATDILRDRKEGAKFLLELTIKEIVERIDGLLEVIGKKEGEYHPGREIKHFCETAMNKFRRCAQLFAGVFSKDPELTEMFPEVKEDIAEAVRLREDMYAFYMELAPIGKEIELQAAGFPKEVEIEDERHRSIDKFLRITKRGEFVRSIKRFQQIMDDYSDLISRMRPTDREIVVTAQMKVDDYLEIPVEKRPSMDKIAQGVHVFMKALQQITPHEINKRELLKHEDKKHMEDAMENLFMSKWLMRKEEISREALLRVVSRLTDATNNLKKAFYRNPKLLVKIQKHLNRMAEELLTVLITSMEPTMIIEEDEKERARILEEERKRKIILDENFRERVNSLLTAAEERLTITHQLI